MDLRPLDPIGDFIDRQEVQKKSISNRTNKRILALAFLFIVVVGLFVWQIGPFRQGYFAWMKSVFSELNPFKVAQELKLSKDSGLDLSEINLENLLGEEKADEDEDLTELIEKTETAPVLTLAEIEEKINKIKKEVEEVSQKVDRLKALTEIQKEINVIAGKTEIVKQEVSKLRALARTKEKINNIAEKTNILNQEIIEEV